MLTDDGLVEHPAIAATIATARGHARRNATATRLAAEQEGLQLMLAGRIDGVEFAARTRVAEANTYSREIAEAGLPWEALPGPLPNQILPLGPQQGPPLGPPPAPLREPVVASGSEQSTRSSRSSKRKATQSPVKDNEAKSAPKKAKTSRKSLKRACPADTVKPFPLVSSLARRDDSMTDEFAVRPLHDLPGQPLEHPVYARGVLPRRHNSVREVLGGEASRSPEVARRMCTDADLCCRSVGGRTVRTTTRRRRT